MGMHWGGEMGNVGRGGKGQLWYFVTYCIQFYRGPQIFPSPHWSWAELFLHGVCDPFFESWTQFYAKKMDPCVYKNVLHMESSTVLIRETEGAEEMALTITKVWFAHAKFNWIFFWLSASMPWLGPDPPGGLHWPWNWSRTACVMCS